MTDPTTVMAAMDQDTRALDQLGKDVDAATNAMDAAEQVWDEVYDAVMATLEEEYADAGRKSVPEHAALSAARREHRKVYQDYRSAGRRLARLQFQLQATRAALSGRQSELGALRDEARVA